MPKASHAGATYYGYEGHVVDARDRVSELDPSRNVDGSIVDGFESEEREIEDRSPEDNTADLDTRRGEATPIEPPSPQVAPEDEESEDEKDEEPEEKPAPAKRASSQPRARGGARK